MRIKSLSVSNMWSFTAEGLKIDKFGQHNIVIGKNNSGKSNVLAAIEFVRSAASRLNAMPEFRLDADQPYDPGQLAEELKPSLSVVVEVTEQERGPILNESLRFYTGKADSQQRNKMATHANVLLGSDLHVALRALPAKPNYTIAWDFGYGPEPLSPSPGRPPRTEDDKAHSLARSALANVLMQNIASEVNYVGGWRSLSAPLDQKRTIISDLHQWQAPSQDDKAKRHVFDRTQDLFRELMRNERVELKPEHSGKNIHLLLDGRYLPIESFGDGIQHPLMIAYHLAVNPRGVLLVEEPETHLHPELQRNLAAVMRREAQGQTFVTTHAPALLDAELNACIFRVEHDGNKSVVTQCKTTKDLCFVLDLLDVRASDLLQANLVIWVEGPTDRMFIKHALNLFTDARFTEGVDYQFAYYGGRVRSHFTFDEELADELVNLLKLCRNVVMVCDSDRDTADVPLDNAKERLRQECLAARGHYWVTDGREIENYVSTAVLSRVFQGLLGDRAKPVTLTPYQKLSDVLASIYPNPQHGDGWKVNYEENKARVMPEIVKHMTKEDLGHLGLDKRLDELVKAIERANPT